MPYLRDVFNLIFGLGLTIQYQTKLFARELINLNQISFEMSLLRDLTYDKIKSFTIYYLRVT